MDWTLRLNFQFHTKNDISRWRPKLNFRSGFFFLRFFVFMFNYDRHKFSFDTPVTPEVIRPEVNFSFTSEPEVMQNFWFLCDVYFYILHLSKKFQINRTKNSKVAKNCKIRHKNVCNKFLKIEIFELLSDQKLPADYKNEKKRKSSKNSDFYSRLSTFYSVALPALPVAQKSSKIHSFRS